jgi:predicted enzyme related to lactoylglutathione lyase
MGWDADDQFHEGHLIYTMFSKNQQIVAGLGRQPAEMSEAGIPPMWTSYVNVDDLDVAAAAFVENGGNLVMPPMDVMEAGRMAYGMDPVGAPIGFWQPKNHRGADNFNEPGFMTWNELTTRNVREAIDFWTKVMPWTVVEMDMGGTAYQMVSLGDRLNCGIMAMDETWPEDMASHWMVYFRVEDTEAAINRAIELGGDLRVPAFDTQQGKVAIIADPQGGVFSIIDVPPDQH